MRSASEMNHPSQAAVYLEFLVYGHRIFLLILLGIIMKKLLWVMTLFLFGFGVNTSSAFDKNDLAKVLNEEDCPRCDLSGADLRGAELLGIDLTRVNFRSAKLKGVLFISSSFCPHYSPQLEDADFEGADLEETDLEDAKMNRANLKNANLSNSNLTDVVLDNANLENTNFKNANLMRASLVDANIKGATFEGVNLESVTWINGIVCKKGSIGRCVLTD